MNQRQRVLIIGDSLTSGHPGVSYVPQLQRLLGKREVVAKGRGADTLTGVAARTPGLVRRYSPELLLIAAGANDLLLPHVQQRGGDWRIAVDRLAMRGSVPLDNPERFRTRYSSMVSDALGLVPNLGVLTITCLGEDLLSDINQRRAVLNDVIRDIARENRLLLIDAAEVFDRELEAADRHSAYLLEDFQDLRGPAGGIDPEAVSRERQLLLTIDGVHLNGRGAKLFAGTVAGSLALTPVAPSPDNGRGGMRNC